jgi:hypothetical protein
VLQRRRDEIHARHQDALSTVERLVETQNQLGKALDTELTNLKQHEAQLHELEAHEGQDTMLAGLLRRFTNRRAILGRKSVAEGLLRQYELASVRLRQASAFSDELRLTALEMQDQVDQLHGSRVEAAGNQRLCAERILQLERDLQAAEQSPGPEAERARRVDQLTFELRTETLNLELFKAAERLSQESLSPSRALRDTVMELHEGMAGYVLNAGGAVDSAGRRIQALGMAADAPTVVAELQESLTDLSTAMDVTQAYVEQTQLLLTEVLPDLSSGIRHELETRSLLLTSELGDVSREVARSLADQKLKEHAEAEVEAWLQDESG